MSIGINSAGSSSLATQAILNSQKVMQQALRDISSPSDASNQDSGLFSNISTNAASQESTGAGLTQADLTSKLPLDFLNSSTATEETDATPNITSRQVISAYQTIQSAKTNKDLPLANQASQSLLKILG